MAFLVSYPYDQQRLAGTIRDEPPEIESWCTVLVKADTPEGAILKVHETLSVQGPFKVEPADDYREVRRVVE